MLKEDCVNKTCLPGQKEKMVARNGNNNNINNNLNMNMLNMNSNNEEDIDYEMSDEEYDLF